MNKRRCKTNIEKVPGHIVLTLLKYSILTAAGFPAQVYCNKDTYERWVKLYELGIIISGLLTTSTFPRMFSPYLDSNVVNTGNIGIINSPDHLARMFCINSFSWSLSCIFCCFVAIILPSLGSHEQFYEMMFKETVFKNSTAGNTQSCCSWDSFRWDNCLSCICLVAALSFAIEFVAALIAAFLFALGFLKQAHGGVAVALGPGLAVIVALLCLVVFIVVYIKAATELPPRGREAAI